MAIQVTEDEFKKAEEKVKAVTTPETFDFLEAVMDRSYPESDVIVVLDEKNIQELISVYNARELVQAKFSKAKTSVKLADEHARLDDEYNAIVARLAPSTYTVKIKGISPEENIALEELAEKEFPTEYDETTSPVTGAVTKTEKPNEKREAYYASLIRQAHIISVTRPDGAVDADWTQVAKVQKMINRLPFLARQRIDEAINEATITADFYRVLVDPVF